MTFLGFHYLPWLLGALVLGTLALLWSAHARRTILRRLLGGHPSAPALCTTAAALRSRLRTVAILASLLFLGVTILRPTGGSVITENRLPAKNLILLIDVSKSMGVGDADGLTRLEAAKLFAREFIARRPADRIGLVSFDGAAFPECPTTLSRSMLLRRLDIQTPGGLPVQGSDLPAALREAANLLTNDPPPGSAVILLSDGDRLSRDPAGDAATIASRKVPLFAIHFGDPGVESPIPDSTLQSRADPNTIRQLARAGGGIALPGGAGDLDRSLQKLGSRIDTMKITEDADFAADLRSRPLELYAYPLALALAFLFLRFFLPARSCGKWHPLVPAIIVAVLILTPNSLTAQTPDASPDVAEAAPEIYPPFAEALTRAGGEKRPLLVLFTGSDWSEASIRLETEILSHKIYRQWAERSVVVVSVDLPRAGLDAATRRQRRELASRLGINAFPTALFLDATESELGRLGHDPNGPASWVRRAEFILAGDRAVSTLESSVQQLPDSVRQSLEAPGLTPVERAIRYYNQALEYRRLDPALASASPDRFELLDELLSTASSLAPPERPDLAGRVANLRATLHHARGQSLLPPKPAAVASGVPEGAPGGTPPPAAPAAPVMLGAKPDPEAALDVFSDALAYYQDEARFGADPDALPPNLARLQEDIQRAENLIAFEAAYLEAVEKTGKVLAQEDRFRESLERRVTTTRPVNDEDLAASRSAITRLVEIAEIVGASMLEDIHGAEEDIQLAPDPHQQRQLDPSAKHIRDAYDHLMKFVQQKGEDGSGKDQQDEEDDDDEEEDEQPKSAGGDQDLRRSRNDSGDLRDRQLKELGRKARAGKKGKSSPGQQH